MIIIYYIAFVIILIIILHWVSRFFRGNKLNLFITIMCSLIIVTLILNPQSCISSSLQGAQLFVYKVFPTMFPFVILTNIIIDYDGVYIYAKTFGIMLCKILRLPKKSSIVLIISILCGYPLGAKYCCDLYEKKEIDFNTAERLLNVATNCSPLFIVGTIGSSMLNSKLYGYLLLISGYVSCFVMSILLPSKNISEKVVYNNHHDMKIINLGQSLKGSVENSIYSCSLVAGFIVVFSVLLGQIKNTLLFTTINQNNVFGSILLGMIEMTNGCSIVNILKVDTLIKLMLFSFFTSFGGLCVMSQVYAFTYKYKFSMLKYLGRKLLQGIISAVSTFMLYVFFSHYSLVTINSNHLVSSEFNLNLLILLFICPFIMYKLIKLIKSF